MGHNFPKCVSDLLSPKLFITSVAILGVIVTPHILFARIVELSAIGEYVMGDNDTYTEAKKLALQDAKRIIMEQVGTYIESKTEVRDGVFSSDEIKQYSAGIIKVEEISEEKSLLANKAMVVRVSARAILDPDALVRQILNFRNRQDIEESARKLSFDNTRLRREMELINQQLRNAVEGNEYKRLRAQREDILKKIDANEQGLTLVLSGSNLYTAALLNRQEKVQAGSIVRKFLKALPSSYKLSVSSPEVQDNGNGTANVILKVDYKLPLVTKNHLTSNIAGISGVDLNEFWSTGLVIRRGTGYAKGTGITISCDKDTCEEALNLLVRELKSKPLVLSVTLGKYRLRREMSDCTDRYASPFLFSTMAETFKIKVPLAQLKSLSQLKARVLYSAGK